MGNVALVVVVVAVSFGALVPTRLPSKLWKLRPTRARRSHRRAEGRYRVLVESSSNGMVVLNAAGRIVLANETFCSMAGQAPARLIDTPFIELLPEADRPGAREQLDHLFGGDEAGEPPLQELRFTNSDGPPLVREVRSRVLTEEGRDTYVLYEVCDARHQAERRLDTLFERAQNGLMLIDAAGEVQFANPAMCRMLGIVDADAEQPDDMQPFLLADFVHPDDVPLQQACCEALLSGTSDTHTTQLRLRRRDGSELIGEFTATRVSDAPATAALLVEIRDMTEQLQREAELRTSEERLQRAQATAGLGGWEFNLNSDEVWWSDEQYRLLGLDPMSATPNLETAMSVTHPEDIERVRESLTTTIRDAASGRPGIDRTVYRVVMPDSEVRTLLASSDGVTTAPDGSRSLTGWTLDITERVKQEEALRLSEERLARAQATATLGAWDLDTNTGESWISDELRSLLGVDGSQSRLGIEGFLAMVRGDGADRIRGFMESFASSGASDDPASRLRTLSPATFEITRPDGRKAVLEVRIDPPDLTRPGRMTGTVLDVTERAEREATLRASEARLERAQQTAHMGSWEYDFGSHDIWWSDQLHRLFGFEPGAVRPSDELFYSRVHPDDRDRLAQQITLAVERGLDGDGSTSRADRALTIRILDQSGGTRILEARLDGGDSRVPGRLSGTFIDVTEREEATRAAEASEARLAAVLHTTTSAIVVWSNDRPAFFNAAAPALLGYTDQEFAALTADQVIHPDDVEQLKEAASAAVEGDHDLREVARILRKDGSTRTVQVTGGPFTTEDGKRALLIEWTDLTEEIELREYLFRAQKNEALGTLVAGISHDFNNLLTIIGMNLELARDSTPESEFLSRAAEANQRASSVVRQLLEFSRPREYRPDTAVDVAKIAEDTIALISRAVDRRIHIGFVAPAGGALVFADQTQLQQVLMNLLVNARDAVTERLDQIGLAPSYTPAIRVRVEVVASPEASASDERSDVRITVSDNGVGVPAEIAQRVFDPYFTTKSAGQGTGLGLATTKSIVEGLGGSIRLRPRGDEGTSFIVRMPAASTATRANSERALDVAHKLATHETVLVVDDEEDVLIANAEVLEDGGFEVLTATGGDEAVSLVRTHADAIDLVLLDVNMPGRSGWEIVDEIKRIRPQQRVLMVSGYASEEMALSSGAVGLLQKPYARAELLEAIHLAIEQQDSARHSGS